uniref:Lipocalin n=1 Tax=Rhipicephalus zambeziensis TaxID=60191 RepID=A0A224YCL9_9ACAR
MMADAPTKSQTRWLLDFPYGWQKKDESCDVWLYFSWVLRFCYDSPGFVYSGSTRLGSSLCIISERKYCSRNKDPKNRYWRNILLHPCIFSLPSCNFYYDPNGAYSPAQDSDNYELWVTQNKVKSVPHCCDFKFIYLILGKAIRDVHTSIWDNIHAPGKKTTTSSIHINQLKTLA